MEYRKFEVYGFLHPFENKKKRIYNELSMEDARVSAINAGFTEPLRIIEIENEPTDAQIEFAQDLGVRIPPGASRMDVSILIDQKLEHDESHPSPGLIEFAKGRGLSFPTYVGKKWLYDYVFFCLPTLDRIAFFVFSIYRYLSEDREANLDNSAHRALFYRFASDNVQNESFVRSLNTNYTRGAHLRYFGTLRVAKTEESFDTQGGSKKTLAYRCALDFLSAELGCKDPGTKTLRVETTPSQHTPSRNNHTTGPDPLTKESHRLSSVLRVVGGLLLSLLTLLVVILIIFK